MLASFTLNVTRSCKEFRGIVCRDIQTLKEMNSLSHQDEAVAYTTNQQSAVRDFPERENPQIITRYVTLLYVYD